MQPFTNKVFIYIYCINTWLSRSGHLNLEDKKTILAGYNEIIKPLNLEKLTAVKPLIIFDEIHKMADWKNFLKGFFDTLIYVGQVMTCPYQNKILYLARARYKYGEELRSRGQRTYHNTWWPN